MGHNTWTAGLPRLTRCRTSSPHSERLPGPQQQRMAVPRDTHAKRQVTELQHQLGQLGTAQRGGAALLEARQAFCDPAAFAKAFNTRG